MGNIGIVFVEYFHDEVLIVYTVVAVTELFKAHLFNQIFFFSCLVLHLQSDLLLFFELSRTFMHIFELHCINRYLPW